MSGEKSLGKLLKTLSAELIEGLYVFVTILDGPIPEGINPRMVFHEAEGVTLIMLETEARISGFTYEFPCRMITLNIHSSLEAVGFMAHIATQLAKHDMGVNPVSGFYHDHLFVPDGREQDAMKVLAKIANGATG